MALIGLKDHCIKESPQKIRKRKIKKMKNPTLFLLCYLLTIQLSIAQNVGINEDGSSPDPSAMLDVKSNNKGLLIPRTDTTTVNASNPVSGLMIYQSSDATFYFFDGNKWIAFAKSTDRFSKIVDEDNDTYVHVEQTTDNDTIHFGVAGQEIMYLDTTHLHLGFGQYNNVLIGNDTYLSNIDRQNIIAIGDSTLVNNGVGFTNDFQGSNLVAIGRNALKENTIGLSNIAISSNALRSNLNGNFNIGIGNNALSSNLDGYSNIAIGDNSLPKNESGTNNIAIGDISLFRNQDGSYNTTLGASTLLENLSGNYNTALGYNAGRNVTSSNNTLVGARAGELMGFASNNTYLGHESGYKTTTSSFNVAIGPRALYSQQTGWYNIAIGAKASELSIAGNNLAIGTDANRANIFGDANMIIGNFAKDLGNGGSWNTIVGTYAGRSHRTNASTFVGYRAGHSNTTGTRNTNIGFFAGDANTTGYDNVAVGFETMKLNTGYANTALGSLALSENTNGSENVAVGSNSLALNFNGFRNVAVGAHSLDGNNGSNNVAIGNEAGLSSTSGSGNIFLGFQSGYNETSSNKLYIENSNSSTPLIYGDFSTDALVIHGSLGVRGNYVFPEIDGTANQVLSTDGNGVVSWSTNNDADADALNEIQDLNLSGNDLEITNNGSPTTIDLSPYLDNTDSQMLSSSISGTINDVSITGGNTLSIDVADNDNDSANEIQDLALTADTLTITQNLSATDIDLGPYKQTLSIAMDSLTISDRNKVDLSDYKNNLTKVGKDSLAITFGDTISLIGTQICDVDMDTYIKAEKSMDGDTIHFSVDGMEQMYLNEDHLFLQFGDNNTFIGSETGNSNTATAGFNTGVGFESLKSNNSGQFNTSFGAVSLRDNTSGDANTAIGLNAMLENETGNDNAAVGNQALRNNTSANENTAIGNKSLLNNQTGHRNTAIGFEALYNNTSSDNTALGYRSGQNISGSAVKNIAIGAHAFQGSGAGGQNVGIGELSLNSSGEGNIGIGYFTVGALGIGANDYNASFNVAIGYAAGQRLDGGDNNVYIGRDAGNLNRDGNNNVALGEGAGANMSNTASSNTLVGTRAGYNVAGNGNVMLGYFAGVNESGSNRLYIDNNATSTPLIYGEFDNDKLIVNGSLSVEESSNEIMSTSYNTTDNYGEVTIKDVMTLTPRSLPPSSPSKGMIYYDSDDDLIYYWNGSAWTSL